MDRDSLLLSESNEPRETRKEGYNAIPAVTDYKQPTLLGNVRNFKRFTWVEWVFIFIGLLAFLFSLGITIERFVHFEKNFNESAEAYQTICHPYNSTTNCIEECQDWTCISDFSFAVILIINLSFCLFYGADGLLRERAYEFLGVFVAVILVLLYVTINFIYHMVNIAQDNEEQFSHGELAARIIRLVVSWILGPILVAFAIAVYFRMGKLWFLLVGGNRTLKRAYQCTSFLASLLFFNIQLLINVLVLAYTRNGTFLNSTEKIILPIMVAFIMFITPMGWIGVSNS
uniref:DUF7789 domain-containing protein n=1 Tax=Amphimedon queenslandica TaxID=400682 RepID=A0A1X7TLK7_AMPQE